MSMITATAWVPRGYPKQIPSRAEFNQDEFDRIQEIANLQLDDARQDLEEARNGEEAKEDVGGIAMSRTKTEIDDDLKEYDLEHYDDSPDEGPSDDADMDGEGSKAENIGMFGNVKNLVYHTNNEEDPYITLNDDDAESESEREELQILPTDNVLVAGRVEDEVALLEFYVYEDEADNLYVHHDVMLPAIPLAVEWLNAPIRKGTGAEPAQGNYIAVGTMDPDIEIWDLDIVDSMYPDLILGAGGNPSEEKPARKKKKKSSKPVKTHHTAAVLALAANPNHTNLLASASADTSIKLWDLNSENPSIAAATFDYHSDKVCSLDWHPTQPTILLSGSYDRTVVAADMLSADDGGLGRRTWIVDSDVESVKWDNHDPNFFYVTTENGVVYYFDARNTRKERKSDMSRPVWRLQAHDGPVSAFGTNSQIPGFLATGSSDKTVKLWNVPTGSPPTSSGDSTTTTAGPSLITSRSVPDTGRIFSTSFAPDKETAFRLAIAGSKGSVQIWDTSTNRAVRTAFGAKIKLPEQADGLEVRDRMTTVAEDDSSSESDEGEAIEGGEDDDEEMVE